MKSVPIDQVMEWGPCLEYTKEKVTALFGKRKTLSAKQILSLKIPAKDHLWAVLRNDFFDDKNLRLMACDFAFEVLPIFEKAFPGDNRPRLAIETARRFANGLASSEEIAEAWLAAAVARSAAATEAEAWSAATEAAIMAAEEGAEEGQVEIVKKYI